MRRTWPKATGRVPESRSESREALGTGGGRVLCRVPVPRCVRDGFCVLSVSHNTARSTPAGQCVAAWQCPVERKTHGELAI
jgi:hypothetical protein